MKTPEFIQMLTQQVDPATAISNLAVFARDLNERVSELEDQLEAATRVVLMLATQVGIVDQETTLDALQAKGVSLHLATFIHKKEDTGQLVLEIRVTKRKLGERTDEDLKEPAEEEPEAEKDRPLRRKVPYEAEGRPKS